MAYAVDFDDRQKDTVRASVCMFCDDKMPQASMHEHLLTCGNKTDECPRCRKFIRRAVFTYHYENSCINPDEFEDKTNVTTNQLDIPIQSSSIPIVTKGNNITCVTLSLKQPDTEFHKQNRIVQRDFSHKQVEIGDRDIHQRNCPPSLENIERKQQSSVNSTTSLSLGIDRENYSAESDHIPCEFCREPIKFEHYEAHTKACSERNDERRRNQLQPSDHEIHRFIIRCKYCNDTRTASTLEYHEDFCKQNPENIAFNQRYGIIYRLPSLHNTDSS